MALEPTWAVRQPFKIHSSARSVFGSDTKPSHSPVERRRLESRAARSAPAEPCALSSTRLMKTALDAQWTRRRDPGPPRVVVAGGCGRPGSYPRAQHTRGRPRHARPCRPGARLHLSAARCGRTISRSRLCGASARDVHGEPGSTCTEARSLRSIPQGTSSNARRAKRADTTCCCLRSERAPAQPWRTRSPSVGQRRRRLQRSSRGHVGGSVRTISALRLPSNRAGLAPLRVRIPHGELFDRSWHEGCPITLVTPEDAPLALFGAGQAAPYASSSSFAASR